MSTIKRIALLAGDGIGPELMSIALPLLNDVCQMRGHSYEAPHGLVGWAAYDQCGDTMPEVTWELCRSCDAILFGAVGLPNRDKELAPDLRPERRALLPIRKEFGLGCNIRPITVHPSLADISPIKNKWLAKKGVCLTFFRELVGDVYFGERRLDPNGQWAEDVCRYERKQIASIARAAFDYARVNGHSVTSIDKANVCGATGTFWRGVVQEVHDTEFPRIALRHEYVDAFNLYLFTRPGDFEVVLCPNAYGDILSDGAAGLAGSMGLLPSASINLETGFALYEPAGGSAPDIAGKGLANPIAMILSVAMLFRQTFRDHKAAIAIESAVNWTLSEGYRTRDLVTRDDIGIPKSCGTSEMYAQIRSRIKFD